MLITSQRFLFVLAAILLLGSCAKISIKDGLQAYNELRYQDAITHLENGLSKKEDPAARRALAASYLATNQFQRAEAEYSILTSTPGNTDVDRINYGRALMGSGKYDEALDIFEGILSREPSNVVAQNLRSSCLRVDEIKADSSRYTIKSVPVSGVDAVYSPLIHGNKLYFSAEKSGAGEVDQYTGLKYTDLYVASLENGSIGATEKVGGVNGKYHDGIAALSGDGNTMILTRSNYEGKNKLARNAEDLNMTQLFISTKDAEGNWSEPQLLPFCKGDYMFAHPALTDDGTTLYFSSDMSNGYGGMDLYMSRMENNTWSQPKNLGAPINTPGNEVFPTLRSNDSLYFSSNAHLSLGGLDLLYAVKNDDTWNGPFHLPYPMNSGADDFGMTFVKNGDTGYFSSDRSGRDNLYSFEESDLSFVLKGLVTSKSSGDPIEGARVIIQNLTDGSEEVIESDNVGMFELNLVPGKDYRVRAEKDGYFSVNEDVTTKNKPTGGDINLNLALLDLSNPDGTDVADNNGDGSGDNDGSDSNDSTDGKTPNLKNLPDGVNPNRPYEIPEIHWNYDEATIRPDAEPYLNYLAKLLKDNDGLKVEISSHADSRGSMPYNDELSEARATAVSEYLVSKGVRRSMLISRGYGERKLVNGCSDGVECTETQHEENRRTEFRVIE
jgi:outer membrane protein OmpA-like peptidoglycan-associated protein/tetratricopeptide (TPR) repeat protein